MGAPTFTVIIPAHNAEDVLGDQLDALCAQDYAGTWDVIVVDNLSTDGTAGVATQFRDKLDIRVVNATERPSAAHARNVGIKAAGGEWLIFLDSDDVADARLISTYARAADGYRIMGGHLDDFALNDRVVASWRFALTGDGLPLALERFPYVLTSNCAIRRDVFDEIGVFDEELEFYGEDVDISARMSLAGIEIAWVPEAVVNYRHRNSLRDLARQQFIWGRGSVVMYVRYGTSRGLSHRITYSLSQALHVLVGVPNLVRSRSRRGQWIRFASFVAGQVFQSVRMRTWYLG